MTTRARPVEAENSIWQTDSGAEQFICGAPSAVFERLKVETVSTLKQMMK
jgi:hypothetical protein